LLSSVSLFVSGAFGSEQVEAENLIDNAAAVVKGFAADPDL